MRPVELLGFAAGTLTTGAFAYEVSHVRQRASATGLRLEFLALFGVGVAGFLVYATYRDALALQLGQVGTIPLVIALVVYTVRYGGRSWGAGAFVVALIIVLPLGAHLLGVPASIIGGVSAVLTSIALAPQVLELLQKRTAEVFAWKYLYVFGGGVLLWAVYGLLAGAPAASAAQILPAIFVSTIIHIKRIYR